MNLPNILTLFRIVLIPFFMYFILADFSSASIIAAIVFAVASFTDFLDGYLARKNNQVTNFGKIMDPLADKLMVAAALISLVELGSVPSWIVILILGREFAITGLRSVAAAEGIVVAASNLGKYKTVAQIFAIIFLILGEKFILMNISSLAIGTVLLYIALFLTLYSGIDYFIKVGKKLKWS